MAAVVVLLAVAAQGAAAFRTSIHWDEFALLHHADLTLATGVFHSGGRPGLSTLVLLPFVEGCDDEVEVVRRARLLWVLFTAAFLAGLWMWMRPLTGSRDASLAVALLALVPVFLETSVQVRTDQLALLGGAWGGAALLASRRRPALAVAAGLAFGVGLLGSQKLLYLGALAGLLAAGQLWLAREVQPRREALRLLFCVLGVASVLFAFRLLVQHAFDTPPTAPSQVVVSAESVSSGLSRFEFYRNTIGWSEYAAILPSLGPHVLLFAALAIGTHRALSRNGGQRRLALAWAVLAAGGAVTLFHAAAFGYFWMTLGVFPAVALALALRPVLELAPPMPARARGALLAGFAALLLVPAGRAFSDRQVDAQAVQRESLAFVHRNFDAGASGFHPERALVCQDGAQPGITWFSQNIYHRFGRDEALRAHHTRRLVEDFRSTPVLFLLQSFRLNQFPIEVRRFWAENYQPYRASVFVAGRRLGGSRGERSDFELVAPGRYRWVPFERPEPLAVDGRLLHPGEVVAFEAGPHQASFVSDVPDGMLVLALDEAPGDAPQRFYR